MAGGGEVELDHNTPSACRLSKRRISNILGTTLSVKLKLTGLVVGDIELTKRACSHPTTTTSTITATSTTTASAITTATTTPMAKGIKAKILGNVETVFH
jgi:hypothetical protein